MKNAGRYLGGMPADRGSRPYVWCAAYLRCLIALFAMIALEWQAFAEDSRTWKDTTGKFSREAIFHRLDGGTVNLRLSKNGTAISVPLAKLSAADQAFAREAEEQASIKRAAYIKRQNDLALAILFSDREARLTHLLAQTLGFGCMQGMPKGEVTKLCDVALNGFEIVSIPVLRKYLASAEHDDQTRKAFATVVSRQQKAVEELQAVKSLVETDNADRARRKFIDAKMAFEDERDVPFESTRLCEVPRCFDVNDSAKRPAAFSLGPNEANAIVATNHQAVQLDCVTSLSPEVAALLVEQKPVVVDLSGLLELPDQTAEVLAQAEKADLYLNGLRQLSDSAARALANGELSYVNLVGVRELSTEAFASLLKVKEGVICGIETLPANAGELLAKRCPPAFFCSRLTTIQDDVLETIVSKADRLALGLNKLTKKQALILAGFKGSMLLLDSVESLDAEVAELLADCKGELSLAGVEKISDGARKALVRHEGAVRIGGEVERRNAFMHASDGYSLRTEHPSDAAAMVLVFSFREASQAHLVAHALAIAALTGIPRDSLEDGCNKAIAGFVGEGEARLHKYLTLVRHDEQAQELFGQISECRNCVRSELLAAKALIESGNGQAARDALGQASRRWNEVAPAVVFALLQPQRVLAQQDGQDGDSEDVGSLNEGVFEDDEWAAVVTGLQERGVIRSAGDANVYFGTFALLKSVFVEKKIPEPTAKQLFGLAKILNVPIGQMEPEKMESALRTMRQLAKETGTEVASRESLLQLSGDAE